MDQIGRYLRYYLKSKTIYSCHSSTLYEFTRNVIEQKQHHKQWVEIEHLRNSLKKDNTLVQFKEFGAGSQFSNRANKRISEIANSSLSRMNQCRQLFHICNHYKPATILELGTSLGIGTMYLSLDNKSKVYTLEGDPKVAEIAKDNFKKLKLKNITLIEGKFEDTLQNSLDSIRRVDLAFIDGNHRLEPTVSYYKSILPYTKDGSILIFDDIHWSTDMEKAWKWIKSQKEVSLSIDLYHMGVIFLNQSSTLDKQKKHYSIIDWYKKPWSIGLFG